MSRTFRKPYTKSKVFDKSCRCGGRCEWCRSNRQYKNKKRLQNAEQELDQWLKPDRPTDQEAKLFHLLEEIYINDLFD